MKKTKAVAVAKGPSGAARQPQESDGRKAPSTILTEASDVASIVAGTHGNPFAVLGVQALGKDLVARCFIPHAEFVEAYTLDGTAVGELVRRHDAGFFEGRLAITSRQPNHSGCAANDTS